MTSVERYKYRNVREGAIMKIAESKTRSQYPLEPSKIIKKTITSTLSWICIGGFLYVWFASFFSGISRGMVSEFTPQALWSFFGPIVAIGAVLTLVLIILMYLYQSWYFATYYYELTDDYIVIKKGPITPKEVNIPYERIQDVYVDQDIFDRILNIYDVHLSSATVASGMSAHIDGVSEASSKGLRDKILEILQKKIGKK
jgi:membrane protein YdbS with pleckstrin-like domain